MLQEFKEFVEKFNVLPIAIGLIMATAFMPVVDAMVNVILSLIGKVGFLDDGETFEAWAPADIPIGLFIAALFSFLVVAFVIFMLVKQLTKAGFGTTPAKTPDIFLLEEIRDTLQAR
jgi:large conductance mechanosensitive channel